MNRYNNFCLALITALCIAIPVFNVINADEGGQAPPPPPTPPTTLTTWGTLETHSTSQEASLEKTMAARERAAAPGVEQKTMEEKASASKVVKAQKAADSAGVSQKEQGEEALKLLDKLPAYGLGVLTSVRNLTKYSISIESGAKSINDQLPEGTIVRIKSLEPRFGPEGKYYTLRKGGGSKGALVFSPDSTDPKDKSTYFVVKRRVSPDLKDWLGFTHPIADDKNLEVKPVTLDLGFFDTSFLDEKDTQSHWSIVGKSLDKCSLKNRQTGGYLSFFSGEKEVKTTKSTPMTETFGILPAGYEIISAIFSEEKGNQYNVTDVIRGMLYKDGKIEIRTPGDLYALFGKPKQAGLDTPANLVIRVKNGNNIQDIKINNGSTEKPNPVITYPDITFSLKLPRGAAETGTLAQLQGNDWRGQPLEYNTLVSIAPEQYPNHLIWTVGRRDWGKYDWLVAGDPDERHAYAGPQLFKITSKADPKKTGPINYGEEVEIWSVYQSPADYNRTDLTGPAGKWPEAEVSTKKWWVNIDDWWTGSILIAPSNDDDRRPKSSLATFTLVSPNQQTGIVYQNDVVNIINNPLSSNGDDAHPFSDEDKKRYTGQRLWINLRDGSRFGGDRADVRVRDQWGADKNNRYQDRFAPPEPRNMKYDLTGDNSIRWGGFRIQAANVGMVDPKDLTAIYATNGMTDPKVNPGKLTQISIKNTKEIWGVNSAQEAWKWNGTSWLKVPTPNPLKQICVDSSGDVWAVSTDNKVWQYTKPNWSPLGGDDMKQISLVSSQEVWGIGADDFIYQFNGSSWTKLSPDEGGIINISASNTGTVWAIDIKKRTWRLSKDKSWVAVNSPADKAGLIQLAVRTDNDVWATADDGSLYHWDGKTWTKQPGNLCYVAVASGTHTVVLKTEKKKVDAATTTDAKNKPITAATAAVKIEVVQLGMGGNLPSGKTVQVNIPALKSPVVSGFAATRIDSFEPGSKLIVIPLLNRGGAWPESSLGVPGRTTVSFLAKPEDAGDIQVLFGPEISDNYTWKVVIGGWNNTKSAIIKRAIINGKPKEIIMYEISKKENPLAFAPPGNFTPYWVSYDKGFIMVGMGLPGQNVFMAQRVKLAANAPEITHVGFGSNKTNVEYTELTFSPPVIINKPDRVYAHSTETISLAANQAAFTWTKYPFRANDRGSISFEIQGTDEVVLALGSSASNTTKHYAIVFSSGKDCITIKKWDTKKKTYITRASLPKATYPALELKPDKSIPVWVSYQDGMFAIGNGSIGQKPVFVFNDLNDYEGIHTVGFGTFGKNPATIKNLQATPPVIMSIEQKGQDYQTDQDYYQFKGAVTIIMPFEYQFTQKDASVIATDRLSNEVFYAGATPGGGNLFKFLLKVNLDGYPELVWETEPENATQKKVQQAIVQTASAAELARAKSDLEAKEGARVHALATAQSKIERAKAEGTMDVASTMTGVASALGMAGGGGNISGGIALAVAAGIGVGGIVASSVASSQVVEAAKMDYEGAKVEALQKAKSQELEAAGNNLQFQSNLLAGNANFAFKSPNSYVFVDSPVRQALGGADIPDDVKANAQKTISLMNQAVLVKPTSAKNFEVLVTLLQQIVFLCTHSFVITDLLKKNINLSISDLFTAYDKLFAAKPDIRVTNDFINLLLTAVNNGYLFSSTTDKQSKENIYVWINKLAQNLLMKNPTITLKPCFGEYIWLPVPMAQADQGGLQITVDGMHDVFVCFAKEPLRVRNSTIDIYEINLAGWDNTKHAIRVQSLGRSVKEFTKAKYPDTMMNPYAPQTYTIMLDNGKITIECQGQTMTWKDPYPIKGIKWIGISCWDTDVNFKQLKMLKGSSAAPAKTKAKPTAVDSAAADSANAPVDNSDSGAGAPQGASTAADETAAE